MMWRELEKYDKAANKMKKKIYQKIEKNTYQNKKQ